MLAGARENKTIDARLGKNGPGRNAGQEHAGTQGWRRSRQVARLPSAGGVFEASLLAQASQKARIIAARKASPSPLPLRGASLSFKLRPVTASSGKNNRKTQLMQNIRTVALRAANSDSRATRSAERWLEDADRCEEPSLVFHLGP